MGRRRRGAPNGAMDKTTHSPLRRRRMAYPFQLRDPVDGRKVRARFLANVKEIDGCLSAWEIVGGLRAEPSSGQ